MNYLPLPAAYRNPAKFKAGDTVSGHYSHEDPSHPPSTYTISGVHFLQRISKRTQINLVYAWADGGYDYVDVIDNNSTFELVPDKVDGETWHLDVTFDAVLTHDDVMKRVMEAVRDLDFVRHPISVSSLRSGSPVPTKVLREK